MAVEFRLLGEVEAVVDGERLELGHGRQRCVLAVLLADANRAVPADRVLERVWGDRPPDGARGVLRTYLCRLRRALAPVTEVAIVRRPDGYALTVDPEAVDLHRFGSLLARARAAGDDDTAVDLFDRALGLWRGEPFGVADTPWLNAVREGLLDQWRAATLDRNDAGLRAGRHGRLLPDILAFADAHPLDERLAAQIMLAHYRCGRRADALAAYQRTRRLLRDNLGVDPGTALQALHQQVLAGHPALEATATAATPVPRQLPAPPSRFTGRSAALAELDAALDAPAATVVISAIAGAGGIGKTWLALRWAHDNAARFPDGQLYVNLRGFDPAGEPVTAAAAVRGFLEALGVTESGMPAELDGRVGLYRSLIAARRMLIVVDNARDAGQVVPLLPGAAPCVVLVTSRCRLIGLISAYGARPLTLDVLTGAESRQLLADRVGADRTAAEPEATAALLRWCAGLPLALSIVAARAASSPELPLAALADELRDAASRLDALDGGEVAVSVRAVLSVSHRALTPGAARLFGLMGLCPGPDLALPAVASLAALPVARAANLLRELVAGHLVQTPSAGRYRMHDLVRLFAAERIAGDEQATAVRRILDHYAHTAANADRLLAPNRDPIAPGAPMPGVVPESFDDHGAAHAWFAAQHTGLRAAVDCAADAGLDPYVCRLAWGLTTFLDRAGHWQDRLAVHTAALAAAGRLNDVRAQAHAHREVALAYVWPRRHEEADRHLRRALELFRVLRCARGQADTERSLARVRARQGRHREALPHDREALALYRITGNRPGEAVALNAIGWHYAHLGEPQRALTYCAESLALHEELADRHGTANTLDSLGYAYHRLGRHLEAGGYFRAAAGLFDELGDRYRQGATYARLGDAHAAAGDTAAAHRAWRRALGILMGLGHPEAHAVREKLSPAQLTV
ncbi:AfsR/SARP family transcriptional regulator [Pseudosporangium ferrugineum]|uniref:DNA-binding SARP family transcriptional activator n=1 Tax=Pseudosporangium ferrugineum TaxID=439699 RepID=A0A2T0RNZ6_9ACTN|nr:BTAD domain-containing putative transcriptional regulator [Pseudosporangium ferrugineum]PRY22915.1 DNA-binding SARP family transcriptional activator [Pseudosporangium ferrugineum]